MSATLALSLLNGMETSSWYAELALRRRVSMSAIGSVIVIGLLPSLAAVSACCGPSASSGDLRFVGWYVPCGTAGRVARRSPARLGDAGQLARVRHLAQADAAQPELLVHRVRSPALLAAGVAADLEL